MKNADTETLTKYTGPAPDEPAMTIRIARLAPEVIAHITEYLERMGADDEDILLNHAAVAHLAKKTSYSA